MTWKTGGAAHTPGRDAMTAAEANAIVRRVAIADILYRDRGNWLTAEAIMAIAGHTDSGKEIRARWRADMEHLCACGQIEGQVVGGWMSYRVPS